MEHQVRSRAREGAWQEAGGAVQQYHVANGSLTELVGRHVVSDLQRGQPVGGQARALQRAGSGDGATGVATAARHGRTGDRQSVRGAKAWV